MARPKKLVGDGRDGYVNLRISDEQSQRLNCLAFLLDKSGADLVRLAIDDLIAKYKSAIDAVAAAKLAMSVHVDR